MPKIETMKDVVDNHVKRVVVEGVYTQVDIRMKRENPPVLYSGQVCVKLEDNTHVFVYPPTSPEAIRPKREIREMENQRVRAIGIIYKHMPQSDAVHSRLPQHVVSSPYITHIESLELVNPPERKRR